MTKKKKKLYNFLFLLDRNLFPKCSLYPLVKPAPTTLYEVRDFAKIYYVKTKECNPLVYCQRDWCELPAYSSNGSGTNGRQTCGQSTRREKQRWAAHFRNRFVSNNEKSSSITFSSVPTRSNLLPKYSLTYSRNPMFPNQFFSI